VQGLVGGDLSITVGRTITCYANKLLGVSRRLIDVGSIARTERADVP
jgi:hypothetical protein